MKYCVKCANEMFDEAVVCVKCGCPATNMTGVNNYDDVPKGGIKALSFLIPLVGFIMYLVYNDTKPISAKSYGKFALWGIITEVFVFCVLPLTLFLISYTITYNSLSY